MSLLSLRKLKLTIAPTLTGKRVISDYALGGETISYGWYEGELASLLQGIRTSLVTENPSTVYKVTFDLVPLSYDDKLIKTIINNGKMNGMEAMPGMFENLVSGFSVMSDECYILSTNDTQLKTTPGGIAYTLVMLNAVTKNPDL